MIVILVMNAMLYKRASSHARRGRGPLLHAAGGAPEVSEVVIIVY